MKFINLDKINLKDKGVIINNKKYIIPGEISVREMLILTETSEIFENEPTAENIEKMFKATYNVLKQRQPKLKIEDFKKELTGMQLFRLIPIILGVFEQEEEEKEEEEVTE